MKGKIAVWRRGKTARGGVAGFMFTVSVACLGCPGASEQDLAFPRCGHVLFMGQAPHSDCGNRLEFESWLCHLRPGCPWVGPTSPGLTW